MRRGRALERYRPSVWLDYCGRCNTGTEAALRRAESAIARDVRCDGGKVVRLSLRSIMTVRAQVPLTLALLR
jgi:hypothetical protein